MGLVSAKRLLRRLHRREEGQDLIEMMIVTPILLVMIAAIFDFGFLFRGWEVVTNAAREGARVGLLPGYSCNAAAPDDIQSRVDSYMAASGYSNPGDYVVDMVQRNDTTSVGDLTVCVVRVSMSQQLPSLSVLGRFFGPGFGSVPLVAAAQMRTESQIATPPAP